MQGKSLKSRRRHTCRALAAGRPRYFLVILHHGYLTNIFFVRRKNTHQTSAAPIDKAHFCRSIGEVRAPCARHPHRYARIEEKFRFKKNLATMAGIFLPAVAAPLSTICRVASILCRQALDSSVARASKFLDVRFARNTHVVHLKKKFQYAPSIRFASRKRGKVQRPERRRESCIARRNFAVKFLVWQECARLELA